MAARDHAPMVEFGAMAPPLNLQLEAQGVTVKDHTELMRIEVIAKAVATVKIHGLMSATQADKAYRKLIVRLGKIICEMPAPLSGGAHDASALGNSGRDQ